MEIPRIVQLAETINRTVATLQKALDDTHAPSPSFEENAPLTLPPGLSDLQDEIIDSASELRDLLVEPLSLLYQKGAPYNNASLHAIARLGIAKLVPPEGSIPFSDVAKLTGLDEKATERLLRIAITLRVFREPHPRMLAHTKISKFLTTPHNNEWLFMGTDELWSAGPSIVDALQKWPNSGEKNETAYNLANRTNEHVYDIFARDPAKATRFANVMKCYANAPEYDLAYFLDNYDWEGLGPATVADLGGAHGHVAIALARRFRDLKLIVLDRGVVLEEAAASLPEDVKGRIEFKQHDFFEPHKVQADLYYIRWILHNWSDKYCVQILRALVPVMRSGTRLLIQETCMPEPGKLAHWKEADLRITDITMRAIFNSGERCAEEWSSLVTDADPRFKVREFIEPKGSALALIEVVWEE